MAGGVSEIFRQEALKSKEQPEFRGEIPVTHNQNHSRSLWLLGICVILIVIWSFCGQIDENVYGSGVISRFAQYGSIVSPGNGILISLDVEEGDIVHMGQLVGRIFSKNDFESFLTANQMLQHQQETFKIIKERVEEIKKAEKKFATEEVKRLDASLKRTQQQLDYYNKFINEKSDKLLSSGAVSQRQIMELRESNDKRLHEHESIMAAKLAGEISVVKSFFELENKLLEYELEVRRSRFDAEMKMREILYRSRIISYCNGKVVNINASNGALVVPGQELVRLTDMHATETMSWSTYCYFPVSEAKKIQPGMSVAVTPSTAKTERDGSIYGVVAEVSEDLETKEDLQAFYHNAAFAEYIFATCNQVPVKVKVVLSRNRNNPSGFNWTSGKGPNLKITSGTLCSVRITTDQVSPVQLLLGKIGRTACGAGIMHEKNISSWAAPAGE